ncbi:MAG TPA: carboxypeptidase regulatory-like domain-containing protein [Bryobacteraceae bacterium]|nr:carboxypeptidase regulatory-like domain-containing protein [Bryobacteraceae bacterium]
MRSLRTLSLTAALIGVFAFLTPVRAQSLLSGDIAGVVTDPSSAVISGATVDLANTDTGATQSTTTGANGAYRFSLLKPGHYTVTVKKENFKTAQQTGLTVLVGQVLAADFKLDVAAASSTSIDVTAAQDVLNTSPNGSTSFTPLEVETLPSPGGDITNIALTAAGVTMNTNGGGIGGNFSINGLPGTSNLYTVNGENDMDPYFNINASGPTDLTLGGNEIQDATVLASPYGGQYGQLSGAQVIMATKSGSNAFHGNAIYWWNGRALNSNSFFNNYFGNPRPFSNANQWAASLGGRIIRNRTFFFVDDEGIRFIVPSSQNVVIPTQQFANAVLANVTALQPAEAGTYKQMLNVLLNAPGAGSAHLLPNTTACNTLSLPGFNPATQACAAQFEANASAPATESYIAFRIDHKLTNNDNIYYRYKSDRGTQPSVIDPVSPNFDALSSQPQYDNQLDETHVFSPNATNQFSASLSHYVAQFAQNTAAVDSTLPYGVFTSGTVPFGSLIPGVGAQGFNAQGIFPQGRNVTQYQFIDDYTLVKGRHTLKFGENFRRYDISEHTFFYQNPQVYFGYTSNGLQNFANGVAYRYRRADNLANDVPIALWGVGVYAHDDWRVAPNLTITLGFRVEHNANPVCQFDCFANFNAPFTSIASYTNANPGSVPYSSDINFGRHAAYQGVDGANLLPSVAFRWSPANDSKTVVSGGAGLFYDNAAATLASDLLSNPPTTVRINVQPAAGVLPFDPGAAGGQAIFQASANAFSINKTFSQISSQLTALGSSFSVPTFNDVVGTIHSPRVLQWNFQVQRQLGASTALIANYVGNRSDHLLYQNPWGNAYDPSGRFAGSLPTAAPDPNYGTVTQYQSGTTANYNGLQITVRQQFAKGLSGHFNYTWSHTLDHVSNGGQNEFSSADSLIAQLVPGTLITNYGDADYDIRHVISADLVYAPRFKMKNSFVNSLASDWQLGMKITYHTGLPFSVTDGNASVTNGPLTLLAIPTGAPAVAAGGCGKSAVDTACLLNTGFVDGSVVTKYPAFSFQNRNMFRGPGFFDLDLSLYRNFRIKEKATFGLGMTAYNFLNHPNFANPDSGYGDPTFGMITGTVSQPNSAYGNGLGFDGSVRVIQLTGKLTF